MGEGGGRSNCQLGPAWSVYREGAFKNVQFGFVLLLHEFFTQKCFHTSVRKLKESLFVVESRKKREIFLVNERERVRIEKRRLNWKEIR